MSKKKIPCGGFYLGAGLDIEDGALTGGGSKTPRYL